VYSFSLNVLTQLQHEDTPDADSGAEQEWSAVPGRLGLSEWGVVVQDRWGRWRLGGFGDRVLVFGGYVGGLAHLPMFPLWVSRNQLRRPSVVALPVSQDADCPILHVDMDAFYASVSLLGYPELIGTPVVVGGEAGRGVALTANYEARELGVYSAMPMGKVRRIAPSVTVIPPDFQAYTNVSESVMSLLRSYTPAVELLGLDEAFLDVSGATRRSGSPARLAADIRHRVYDEQGVTCSVGVAGNKFVAKLASTLSKPDGMLVVPPGEVVGFLHPLPVSALWGVGEKTEAALTRLGLETVGDIAAVGVTTMQRAVGRAAGAQLFELAWGRDPRKVEPTEPDRSVGAEQTFPTDIEDPTVVLREILRLSEKVASRVRAQSYVGRTITLKVRFADFHTITRSKTLHSPTDVGQVIYTQARTLFEKLGLQRARIRLVGVRVTGLGEDQDTPQQLSFSDMRPGNREVDAAIDALTERFGKGIIQPARLLD
jgi:DNA polymerase-4